MTLYHSLPYGLFLQNHLTSDNYWAVVTFPWRSLLWKCSLVLLLLCQGFLHAQKREQLISIVIHRVLAFQSVWKSLRRPYDSLTLKKSRVLTCTSCILTMRQFQVLELKTMYTVTSIHGQGLVTDSGNESDWLGGTTLEVNIAATIISV